MHREEAVANAELIAPLEAQEAQDQRITRFVVCGNLFEVRLRAESAGSARAAFVQSVLAERLTGSLASFPAPLSLLPAQAHWQGRLRCRLLRRGHAQWRESSSEAHQR